MDRLVPVARTRRQPRVTVIGGRPARQPGSAAWEPTQGTDTRDDQAKEPQVVSSSAQETGNPTALPKALRN
jgi:hypothetical protein